MCRGSKPMGSIVVDLEGNLVKESDPFPYLMLVAFEASGPIRFALLLLVWPVVHFLGLLGLREVGFKLAVFIAVVGVRISEIEYVGRAVLPRFYMDHIDMDAWRVFNGHGKRVVVSKSPRVMVERFAKEHLGADQVVGSELIVNRFGRATGLLTDTRIASSEFQTSYGTKTYSKEPQEPLFEDQPQGPQQPLSNNHKCIVPVVFHDGRLVLFPKPATALLILMWFPIGVVVAIIRMVIALILPICVLPYENLLYGILMNVKGNLPKPVRTSDSSSGVLLVCNHRALVDPVIVAAALGRKISAVTYSVSRVTEIIAPIRTLRLTRNRQVDAEMIQNELKQGDTVVCPEGTTCREPFLLRFSALFAELTDQIVPVAVNYKPTFFHSTTVRGWKGFDPICFLMNPYSFYEVSFLDQLPIEDTCTGGEIPIDVANDVQRRLAVSLGFECTNFTRKDKYMFLNGTDGRVRRSEFLC